MEYLIETVLQELNEELKLHTGHGAFGGNTYVPENIIYFTIDGIYGKAVLENGKYVYKEQHPYIYQTLTTHKQLYIIVGYK